MKACQQQNHLNLNQPFIFMPFIILLTWEYLQTKYYKQYYRRKRSLMGCTPNFEKIKQQNLENTKPRSTIEIEFLRKQLKQFEDEQGAIKSINNKSTENTDGLQKHQINQQEIYVEIKQKQQKIKYLKGSKNFMEISIEANNYVNHALLTLSNNPLLYDQSYSKLIGLNKKLLCKNQNRYSYLVKKQQKMEKQIKKQKQRILEQSRSLHFGQRKQFPKLQKKFKTSKKQNKSLPSLFQALNKDSHKQKMQKFDSLISNSQKTFL